MREMVEAAYERMLEASASADQERLQAALSRRLFRQIREQLALSDDAIEAFASDLPALSELEFVDAWGHGGEAAALYRSEASPDDDGTARISFVFVKAVDDGDGFRHDGVFQHEEVATDADGQPTRFDPAVLPDELVMPRPKAPSAPSP